MVQTNLKIGQVFESKNYGEFKVISLEKDKHNKTTYNIEFLETNNRYFNKRKNDLLVGNVADSIKDEQQFISRIYKQRCGDSLKIIEKLTEKSKSNNYLYKCEFINYPLVVKSQKTNILRGNVINYNKPTICNVGFLGVGNYNYKDFVSLYNFWHNALHRCYNPKSDHYIDYGEKGVIVCEEWHNFQNFAKWYIENESWNKETNYKLSIDKDILCYISNINKIYSPETCLIVPYDINAFLAGDNLKTGVYEKDNLFYSNICYKNKNLYLGKFDTFEKAKRCYARVKYEIWVDFLNKFNLDFSLQSILLKYDFSWSVKQ